MKIAKALDIETIQPHNMKLAAVWNSAGILYDEISRGIADSIEHCVDRLAPERGDRVLDLACGTGWASRSVAARGARVTGVDLGADLIEAARKIAASARLDIDYRVGDAEKLPFEDESFDKVISTCGIMFASKQEAAATELARVCKKGGKIGLTTWKPDSTLAQMFQVMKKYMPAPPSPPAHTPFEWGSRDRVKELLGPFFTLGFEEGVSPFRAASAEEAWEIWVNHYGPTKTLAAGLDPDRLENFKRDMIAFHERFKTELGVSNPREYLLIIGVRK